MTQATGFRRTRWSYRRDLGRSRLVVIDSRAGRDFDDGRREMLDAEEWRWVEERARAVVTARNPDDVEAWNAAVVRGCMGPDGGLGRRARPAALDLEHWAAFPSSARRLHVLIDEISVGARPPASVVLL